MVSLVAMTLLFVLIPKVTKNLALAISGTPIKNNYLVNNQDKKGCFYAQAILLARPFLSRGLALH